ncbi:hypothetical protein AB0I39_32095 [Kitasatospora purpeofusca]|uniref:hypothetical protein n=1 Tax=Kitasatospora purpeofusca TaxID=67352 RepID=UPI0033FA75C6
MTTRRPPGPELARILPRNPAWIQRAAYPSEVLGLAAAAADTAHPVVLNSLPAWALNALQDVLAALRAAAGDRPRAAALLGESLDCPRARTPAGMVADLEPVMRHWPPTAPRYGLLPPISSWAGGRPAAGRTGAARPPFTKLSPRRRPDSSAMTDILGLMLDSLLSTRLTGSRCAQRRNLPGPRPTREATATTPGPRARPPAGEPS